MAKRRPGRPSTATPGAGTFRPAPSGAASPGPVPFNPMKGVGGNNPPPPVVAPQPYDPALENAKLGAGFNIGIADSESAYQTGQTTYNTGYNAQGAFDASNPYSQAMLLQDEYKRSVTGTQNSYAAQGQLYSGARLNAQARNDRQYAIGSDVLRRQAMDTHHGIGVNKLQSYASNSLGVSQEAFDALRRAIYGT